MYVIYIYSACLRVVYERQNTINVVLSTRLVKEFLCGWVVCCCQCYHGVVPPLYCCLYVFIYHSEIISPGTQLF